MISSKNNTNVTYWRVNNNKRNILITLGILILIIIGIILLIPKKESIAFIESPIQINKTQLETIEFEGKDRLVNITFLAEYKITGIVKSKKIYTSDNSSIVSPMDLAIAWGNLNQEEIDENITYSQRSRWYYYHIKENDLVGLNEVKNQSANTHMIPSDDNIFKQLKKIRKNDMIELEGYLVSVELFKNQNPWTSSLSREDTGDKACEIMYVTKVTIK